MKKLLFLFLMFTTSMSLTSNAQTKVINGTTYYTQTGVNNLLDPIKKSITDLQAADKVKTQTIAELQAQVKNLIADTAAKGKRIATLDFFVANQDTIHNARFYKGINNWYDNRYRLDSLEKTSVLIRPDGSDGVIVGPDGYIKSQYYFNALTGKMERRY